MSTTFDFAYGRRPPKNDPAMRLSAILRPELETSEGVAALPSIPSAQDNLALLRGGWKMLGNDVAGDCVSVTWANVRRLVTAILGEREVYATIDWVWALYQTQNPGFDPHGTADTNGPGSVHDQGMDIQTVLEYLVKVGGPDGVKAVAFAKVDHTNVAQVKAAIAVFGYVWVGVNVTQANEQEFSQGKPWDHVSGSPNAGGHSVITGGFTGKSAGDEEFITWATETEFTDAFWSDQVEEAWVCIWPEHLGSKTFLAGVDVSALAAEYLALTGKTLVITPPAPQPPTPAPATDPDHVLANAAKEFLQHHHTGAPLVMANALRTWLTAKSL